MECFVLTCKLFLSLHKEHRNLCETGRPHSCAEIEQKIDRKSNKEN